MKERAAPAIPLRQCKGCCCCCCCNIAAMTALPMRSADSVRVDRVPMCFVLWAHTNTVCSQKSDQEDGAHCCSSSSWCSRFLSIFLLSFSLSRCHPDLISIQCIQSSFSLAPCSCSFSPSNPNDHRHHHHRHYSHLGWPALVHVNTILKSVMKIAELR